MPVFTRSDFELLRQRTDKGAEFGAGQEALEKLAPKIRSLANDLANRIARTEGLFLFPHSACRMAQEPPQPGLQSGAVELLASATRNRSQFSGHTALAIGITHWSLHCHLIVPPDSEDRRRIGGTMREMATILARHHASFGALRLYSGWDGVGLPEVALTKSPAFWDTMGLRLVESPSHWLDLGLSMNLEEAARARLDDLIKPVQRLLPLYRMAVKEGYRPLLR